MKRPRQDSGIPALGNTRRDAWRTLDENIKGLIERARTEPSRRQEVCDELERLIRGPAIRFAKLQLETYCAADWSRICETEKEQLVEGEWIIKFKDAVLYLNEHDWRIGGGFGISNPRKVSDPNDLRRCLLSAVARDARTTVAEYVGMVGPFRQLLDWGLRQDAGECDPRATAERKELMARVHDAVDRLPAEDRVCVRYYFWSDHTLEQIGALLGMSHVGVFFRLQRSFRLLRSYLS